MYWELCPYHDQRMTQYPWTRATGSSPMARQAAKSGTLNPEENDPDDRRRPAASGVDTAPAASGPASGPASRPASGSASGSWAAPSPASSVPSPGVIQLSSEMIV